MYNSHSGLEWYPCNSYSAPDAIRVDRVLEQGQRFRHELLEEKQHLYESIEAFGTDNDDVLYRLANVKLNDFSAFERLVFGMFDIYDQTVHQRRQQQSYDFRTPALKLTFDFQLAIRQSHMHLRSHSINELAQLTEQAHQDKDDPVTPTQAQGYSPHHVHVENDTPDSREAIQAMLQSMLQEVRQSADQLEQGMHGHNIAFSGGTFETVMKVNNDDDAAADDSGDDNNAILIDQDDNEYIMTRPSDTTVIYEDMQLLHDFILIVVSSYVFGCLFAMVKLPAFFGYILAGVVTGPAGYNMITELIQTETLAQLGVVFIVFVLGLEFSLEKLRAMWRLVLGGATMILLATVLAFVVMGTLLGASLKEAVFVGACVSLSSTAVVVKCIKLDHLEHLYGLLVMQDVLLGFMLAIIPALAESGAQVMVAILKIAVSFSVFGALCYGIIKLTPSFLPRVIRTVLPNMKSTGSHELTVLGTIAVCLVMLVISDRLGLGMEIGCFAAGVLLRSRKAMFEPALAAIEPVRDLFACLFFASIGLHVYPSFLASQAMLLLVLAAGVIGFKYVATFGILVSLKIDTRKSSAMAVALAQISEFAFVLASRAKLLDIISREVYYLLLGVTSLTLLATPLLWKLVERSSLFHTSSSSSSILRSHHHHHQQHHHHHHEEHPSVISVSMDDADKMS
ncbi:hypothetical protein K492DRAFT_240306 [Lichtheimia hyalospora FSU 10163]|nr:hypothetical protein K492DRAFT_240306 [Lichtheimia hyalospora FSU 10163]